jgi:hypothetical protein
MLRTTTDGLAASHVRARTRVCTPAYMGVSQPVPTTSLATDYANHANARQMSPIQRTLAWLREHGYEAQKVEHWNHYARCRQDLFGFVDVLAVSDHDLLAIQTSDGAHHAEHIAKIIQSKAAPLLARHMEIEVWSWSLKLTRQRRKDGLLDRRKEWTLRRDSLTARCAAIR